MDWTEGLLSAVPVKNGAAPVIDGDLADWDLSGAEPVLLSAQTAAQLHADWALMYDDAALYIGVRVSLPERPYSNPNNPTDAFWQGDLIQMRFGADPALPYPLDRQRDAANERVAHVSCWKNSQTGRDYLDIARGTGLDLSRTTNPEGVQIVVRLEGNRGYIVEARLPWAALKVPGGRNPFEPGQRTAFVAETLWTGGDFSRIAAVYRINPGTFAFNSPHTWGQLEFAARGFDQRRRPSLAEIAARLQREALPAQPIGVPFTVEVPADGLKVSVNILGPRGEVLRELIGGEAHPKGPLTVHWDGQDAWRHALVPGSYRWGALFHRGLKIELAGSVGTSGNPTYPTLDGKGAWGGDHADPFDCAADDSGLYFLWPVAEQGRPIVKTDYAGRVLWRKNPFVGGGFGPFFAIASDARFVYLTLGAQQVRLVRLDARTGELLTWGEGGPTELPLIEVAAAKVPKSATPLTGNEFFKDFTKPEAGDTLAPQPDAVGLATHGGWLFVSSYASNKILVVDAASGKVAREIPCPGPRGLVCDAAGNLFAASYVPGQAGQILCFAAASGAALPVVTRGLEAPFDVAVDAQGNLYVSDLGASQQIKLFDSRGALLKTFGKAGGRAWQGKYDADAFLNPAGLALDARGGLLVVESSPPKVISQLSLATGQIVNRWFGPGVYWNSTWPMPDDPQSVFYTLPGALGRARVVPEGETGVPEAYWAPDKAGYPHVESLEAGIPQSEIVRATNGELYLVHDAADHAILLMQDDRLRPIATWRVVTADKRRFPENALGRPYLRVWIDKNGDGHVQADEETRLTNLADGTPIPEIAEHTASLHMEPNGDLYFMTQANSIIKIPAADRGANGLLRWDTARATLAVPEVLPGAQSLPTNWREGILGVRLSGRGEIYTTFNTSVAGKGGAFDYPTPELAARLKNGLGHTSRFNAVKIAKYDAQGRLLWMAGRKATAGAKTGEIYHSWNLAGLIHDRYVAAGSEWGTIAFYTHDGFYVDSLMNNPGLAPPPGPYTFSGETSGARVEYFRKQDEVWAYSSGMAYHVGGFKNGQLEGETRAFGTVVLDRVYATPEAAAPAPEAPMQLARIAGQALEDDAAWTNLPSRILRREDAVLATAQLGYDDQFLYARLHVVDATPLQNGADMPELAFKGGDTAGMVLGPGPHAAAGAGDIRLLAARIGGQPRLIAMKALTKGTPKPFDYTTARTVRFEYVGEVPDGRLRLVADADGRGYTAIFAVPRAFLEFDLTPGAKLQGDLEVRLSGAGSRGLQAMERHYLFTPARPETTMVDDVPTEAQLYPQFWGQVEVR